MGIERFGKDYVDSIIELGKNLLKKSGAENQMEFTFDQFYKIYQKMNEMSVKMDKGNDNLEENLEFKDFE